MKRGGVNGGRYLDLEIDSDLGEFWTIGVNAVKGDNEMVSECNGISQIL